MLTRSHLRILLNLEICESLTIKDYDREFLIEKRLIKVDEKGFMFVTPKGRALLAKTVGVMNAVDSETVQAVSIAG